MGKGKLFRLSWKCTKRGKKQDTGDVKGALEILPAEIWTMILEKVDDFEDRINCFNTCQPWKDILRADLFTREFAQIFPHIMDYLDFPSVLVCRQVCSSWCTAVDNVAGKNHKLLPFNADYYTTSNAVFLPEIRYKFQTSPTWTLNSVPHVKHLLEEMKAYFALGNDRCPITAKYLRVTCLKDPEEQVINQNTIEEHQNLCCELTRSMGHHVRYFSLEFDPRQVTPLKLCQLLARHLRYLTNLRLLVLDAGFASTDPWTLDEYEAHFEYLEAFPLPYIETLESLSFEGIGVPIQMQHQLLSIHGRQLKNLVMQLSRLTPNLFHELMNLTELAVIIDTEADIRTLSLCRAPLLKLSITMDWGTVLLAENLLEVIHGFPTLYQVDLHLLLEVQLLDDECTFIGDEWENSGIEVVKIYIDAETGQKTFPLSFNFLKCFPRLEDLSMEYIEIPADVPIFDDFNRRQNWEIEIIELKKYLHRGLMYHSNIWQVLPELLSLSYEWCGHDTESVEHFYDRFTYNQLNPPPGELAVERNVEGALKKIKKFGCRVGKTVRNVCIQIIDFLI